MKKFAWGGVIALLSANLLTAEIFVKEEAVSIPTAVFKVHSHDAWADSEGWKSAFFGNEITVGNKFDNGFDVYVSVLTGLDGFGSKEVKGNSNVSWGERIVTHHEFKQTFLDNALGAGYTVEFGSSQARLGVDLFHAMDLSTQGGISSRLYLAPQFHYGYTLTNVPLTLGAGAEWDFGIGLQGERGRGGAGILRFEEPDTKPASNPYFWLDASYKATEKISFGLSVGADINESPKTYGLNDKNTTKMDPEALAGLLIPITDDSEQTAANRKKFNAYVENIDRHTYKHTSLSFPIKLGATFR